MDQPNWQHLIEEDLTELKSKYENSSKKMSFLSFCLKGGYLNEETYSRWAQNNYELPKVKGRFFEENTPNINLWKKWKDIYDWSPACLPLGEWDGQLLVGALEPLPELQDKTKVQVLLCNLSDLEDWWKIYHPSSLAKATEKAQTESKSSVFLLDHWKKTDTKILIEVVQYIFSQMKSVFDKTMLLSLNENMNLLRPFNWDEGFKEHSKNLRAIPLKTPSIFNIVASTQKPYHGYVIPNQINDAFFEDWNQGITPEHATLSPIVINDQLIGIILGIGPKSLNTKQTLQKVEALSATVSKKLGQNKAASDAAA